MASSRLTLVVAVFLAMVWSSHALEVVNKGCSIVVFVPPICKPCACSDTQKGCVCTLQCEYVPGVEVKKNKQATLPVRSQDFDPALQYFNVEISEQAYIVAKGDLKLITIRTTVVVTGKRCGKGVEALVYPNPKFSGNHEICLLPGKRYGS